MSSINGLGYLVMEANDLSAWESFLRDTVGLEVIREGAVLRGRVDTRACRLLVREGTRNEIVRMGWETPMDGLDTIVEKLREAGIAVKAGSETECRKRRVADFYSFQDFDGYGHEIFVGAEEDTVAETPHMNSGFITSDQGLGHLALVVSNLEKSLNLFRDTLDFGISDFISQDMGGQRVDLVFLHTNPRHHSLALIQLPSDQRVHHLMLEVGSLDDVGMAYDRWLDAGVGISSMLGKHPNDEMVSFYGKTPGNFNIEIGTNGKRVTPGHWTPGHFDRVSAWGHQSPNEFQS